MTGRQGWTDFADYGRPRRVSGGLRARSTRGAIGQSWWSRRFVDVLESFALGSRLTRGRSYARAGQVISLDVAPGEVTAVVQGSRPEPYRVSIRFRPFGERVWVRVERLLAAQALYSARLLAGDVPPELEQVFAEAGAPLFPRSIDELTQRCTCPDVAVPCKHLAAAFYLLAEAFDADPFQLLHWRGRDRARLLARLRTLRGADAGRPAAVAHGGDGYGDDAGEDPAPGAPTRGGRRSGRRRGTAGRARVGAQPDDRSEVAVPEPPPVGAEVALADLPAASLAEVVDRFWLTPVPLPSRAPVLATEPGLVLRQLGAPDAAIGGPGLVERLGRAYARFGAATD
ncbi:SWIM zinc finger family protein [Micromonospora sp. HM5-17]|uniref:SWIM zinc finger family protein n=1 Tax=Micromonospora sp. HM5-17 TaxID=2487710 RepID=UPI000F4A2696|nr:SWIM zinc finger family protein [Micromonospora sp. HM5-17]ROT31401.1 hypothetical protein EF879_17690 [Micromonospora sp. HM5-17]